MPSQTTGNLSNSIRTQYLEKYMEAAMLNRLYDQFAAPPQGMPMEELQKGSAVQVPFLSDMTPGTTAISEISDVTPQTLRDSYAQITPTSRGEVLQFSQKLEIEAYTDYTARAYERVGKNMIESVDLLAQAAMLQGTHVLRGAARASLDAGTHTLSEALMIQADTRLQSLKVPPYITPDGRKMWIALMHPNAYHDLRTDTNILAVGQYQRPEIILNWELGTLGAFKIIVSPFAKVFGGAGADNGTAVATTLASAANALDTTIVTADDVSANIAVGEMWTVGTEETANTYHPTNERVKVVSASTTTLTIVGEGANGGLRFDHDAGVAVRNADSVYPVALGTMGSIAKLYATEVGEYGEVLEPERVGNLKQWTRMGWKWFGGYGRFTENMLLRVEVAASVDA